MYLKSEHCRPSEDGFRLEVADENIQ